MMKKIFQMLMAAVIFLFIHSNAMAQVEMAELLRSSGKIYAVVAVLVTIFAGIILFLIYLERKIAKMEKEMK